MANSSARALLTDTGFWYAFLDPRDPFHKSAAEKEDLLTSSTLLVPWPVLYETFNTRFAKNRKAVKEIQNRLSRPNVYRLSDENYREDALALAMSSVRPLALVDVVIRLIIDDANVRKQALLTFNPGDFADVCRRRGVEIVS